MKVEKIPECDVMNATAFYNRYFCDEVGYNIKVFYLEDLDDIHNKIMEKHKTFFSDIRLHLSSKVGWCGDEETTHKELEYAFSLIPKLEQQLKQDMISYLKNKGVIVTTREEEQQAHQRAIDEWNSLSTFQQRRIINRSKKKPATLAEGWVVFIILLLVESIFYGAVAGWIGTTILFLIWRRAEIDKYN